MYKIYIRLIILNFIFLKCLGNKYKKIFNIQILNKTDIFTLGYLRVYYQNYQNFSIFMNESLFKWFFNEKGKICQSFNYDPRFSSIRFQLTQHKSPAVFIQKINPCCQMYNIIYFI